MSGKIFQWPEGKVAAISLTFDDARLSQIERGVPLLNEHGVKATFYVSFASMQKRLDGWRKAVEAGHEIGNHTVTHPCSGNFGFARGRALEDFTLERIEEELVGANEHIEKELGVRPKTFAYPCGQKFVGRGVNVKSYVPLVAKHFLLGRGFRDEYHNAPAWCDMAQAYGVDFDRATFGELKLWIARAVQENGWLIFAGHDIGDDARQTVLASMLDELCRFANDASNGIWLDTAASIAAYVQQKQT